MYKAGDRLMKLPRDTMPNPYQVKVNVAASVGLGSVAEGLFGVLNESERERAARFRVPAARASFVAGRGLLRLLLARYLNAQPESLRFTAGPYGKPELAPPFDREGLFFSVSRSAGAVAIAFARHSYLGVDIEKVRFDLDFEGVARQAFSSRMHTALTALPDADRPVALFKNWTRKEAVVKATGRGLSQPLASMDVSFGPGAPPRLLYTECEGPATAWKLFDIDTLPGFVGAVAVRAHDRASFTVDVKEVC